MRYVFWILCLFWANFQSLYGQSTYSEYWQEAAYITWNKGPFQLLSYAKINTGNQWKSIRLYQFSEQFAYQASKDFSWKVNYRYLHGRNIVPGSPWRWQQRLEIEANPVFHPYAHSLIKMRNRLEIRKIEREPNIKYRFRQQTMWVFTPTQFKSLKHFSIYNEIFYDISTHRFQQNRICPCMLTCMLNKCVDIDLYFLVRIFLHEERWKRSFVVGSFLHF